MTRKMTKDESRVSFLMWVAGTDHWRRKLWGMIFRKYKRNVAKWVRGTAKKILDIVLFPFRLFAYLWQDAGGGFFNRTWAIISFPYKLIRYLLSEK